MPSSILLLSFFMLYTSTQNIYASESKEEARKPITSSLAVPISGSPSAPSKPTLSSTPSPSSAEPVAPITTSSSTLSSAPSTSSTPTPSSAPKPSSTPPVVQIPHESKTPQTTILSAPVVASTSWSLFSSVTDTLAWAHQSDGSYLLRLHDQGKLSQLSVGARVAQTAKAFEYNSTKLTPTGADGAVITQRLKHLTQVITLAQNEGITLAPELTEPTLKAIDDHIAQLTKVRALLVAAKKP